MPRVVTYFRSAARSGLSGLRAALDLSPEDTLVSAYQDVEILRIPAWTHLSRDRHALPLLLARLTRAGVSVQVASESASIPASRGSTA